MTGSVVLFLLSFTIYFHQAEHERGLISFSPTADEEALCRELHLRGLKFVRQQSVSIPFKGIKLGTDYWLKTK